MGSVSTLNRDQVYISCLTYLAAEAERDENFVIAGILKSATVDIYDWMNEGSDESQKSVSNFIDSITSAFLFILEHKSLSRDMRAQMIGLINALDQCKMN